MITTAASSSCCLQFTMSTTTPTAHHISLAENQYPPISHISLLLHTTTATTTLRYLTYMRFEYSRIGLNNIDYFFMHKEFIKIQSTCMHLVPAVFEAKTLFYIYTTILCTCINETTKIYKQKYENLMIYSSSLSSSSDENIAEAAINCLFGRW